MSATRDPGRKRGGRTRFSVSMALIIACRVHFGHIASMDERTATGPEVNRLYWESDESVAEISNRLGVSRRALYDLIDPLPAGTQCKSCGGDLFYGNRSAKAAALARCLACGAEREVEADISHEDVGTIPPYGAGWPAVSKQESDGIRERAVAIATFALAGAVFGALATVIIRRAR